MRDFSIALIVVALIAADFGADALGFKGHALRGWDLSASVGLGCAIWHFRK